MQQILYTDFISCNVTCFSSTRFLMPSPKCYHAFANPESSASSFPTQMPFLLLLLWLQLPVTRWRKVARDQHSGVSESLHISLCSTSSKSFLFQNENCFSDLKRNSKIGSRKPSKDSAETQGGTSDFRLQRKPGTGLQRRVWRQWAKWTLLLWEYFWFPENQKSFSWAFRAYTAPGARFCVYFYAHPKNKIPLKDFFFNHVDVALLLKFVTSLPPPNSQTKILSHFFPLMILPFWKFCIQVWST